MDDVSYSAPFVQLTPWVEIAFDHNYQAITATTALASGLIYPQQQPTMITFYQDIGFRTIPVCSDHWGKIASTATTETNQILLRQGIKIVSKLSLQKCQSSPAHSVKPGRETGIRLQGLGCVLFQNTRNWHRVQIVNNAQEATFLNTVWTLFSLQSDFSTQSFMRSGAGLELRTFGSSSLFVSCKGGKVGDVFCLPNCKVNNNR